MEMHIVTMNDKHDDDTADHSMTTINRSREVCTMLHTIEHFVIFDDDDAGDGRDNMLEGDKRGKKGAATWRHCSRPEVERRNRARGARS